MRNRWKSALTLLELLIAIALIGILSVSATFGVVHAIKSAKAAKCLNHLRTLGIASALYSADQGGRLPQSSHQGPNVAWQYVLPAYMENSKTVFRSPLAPNPKQSFSYAINDFLTAYPYGAADLNYSRRQNIDAPSQTLFFTLMTKEYGPTDHFHFAAHEEFGYTPDTFLWQVQTDVSNGKGHYLFVDGHVEALAWKTILNELTRPGSKFIDPIGHKN